MIKLSDIKPDFEMLKKYLNGGESLEGFESFAYLHFERVYPDFNKVLFKNLITTYNLQEHFGNLYIYAYWYSAEWEGVKHSIRNFNSNMEFQIFKELKGLNEFFNDEKCIEIKFISKKKILKVSSSFVRGQIIEDVIKFTSENWNEWKTVEENIKIKMNKWKNRFPKKQSHIKSFAYELVEIYNYLKNETYFNSNNYQNEDIYRFIKDFFLTFGCDKLPENLRGYINV